MRKTQIDETVICYGNITNHLSYLNDNFVGVTWLIEMIEVESKNIVLQIVETELLKYSRFSLKKYTAWFHYNY